LNLGISCVAKEMKNGTSSYLFTKPVPRTEIIFSKVIASALNLLIFSAFSGICNYALIILPAGGLEQPIGAFTTTIGMFLTQLMFFAVGFFCCWVYKEIQINRANRDSISAALLCHRNHSTVYRNPFLRLSVPIKIF